MSVYVYLNPKPQKQGTLSKLSVVPTAGRTRLAEERQEKEEREEKEEKEEKGSLYQQLAEIPPQDTLLTTQPKPKPKPKPYALRMGSL
jgi:hypothetical protein